VNRPDVLILSGGWAGHEPEQFAEHYAGVLRAEGYEVSVSQTLDALLDTDLVRGLRLIVPIWTLGTIRPDQLGALLGAVERGVGLAGFHGGMGDAFREATQFQWMVGGQFVAHPGDIVDHGVEIVDRDSTITSGIGDFRLRSEQYYMHVDPSNQVLATTTFEDGCVMPVAWTRRWGAGSVFYSSLGHTTADLEVPEVGELQRRGMLWAIRS
jgi:type 1 glutamine amidotransferase